MMVDIKKKKTNLTSTPRASSISLFSLSPGPMCLSAKSSCLGKIRSICLEVAAADVLRPRLSAAAAAAAAVVVVVVVVRDAPRFRILLH